MLRNQYDTDVTTFSPAGRLFQVEYACEAVKQGSASVGLVTKEYAVLVSLRRSESSLASYTKKISKIDDHVGASVCGLIPDGGSQIHFLRHECMNEKWQYESPMPVGRLVSALCDKNQVYTQRSVKRPVGVGLLVAGYDYTGAHLFETSPSGHFYEYKAHAIGMRAQAAKTYLEKHYEEFEGLALRDLIIHALRALKATSQEPLTTENVHVGFVGKDRTFTVQEDDEIAEYIAVIASDDSAETAPNNSMNDGHNN